MTSSSSRDSAKQTPIPWLTVVFAIAAVSLTIFAYVDRARIDESATEALGEARSYFFEHPYLEPGPALSRSVGTVQATRLRRDFEAERIRRGGVPIPSGVVRRQQETLDDLVSRALEQSGSLPTRRFGVVPSARPSHAWLSYALLHVSNVHLVGSLLLLLFLGVYLERGLGHLRFAVLALAVTAVGAASFRAAFPDVEDNALVGSSPLAAGLLAAFMLRHWRERGEGFYVAGLVLGIVWLALPPWAGVDWSLSEASLVPRHAPPAAMAVLYACGGAAGGGVVLMGLAALLGLDGRRGPKPTGEMAHPLFARALRAREKGRPREAFESLRKLGEEQPEGYEAALALWEVASEIGRRAEASSALLRAVRVALRRGLSAAAVDHWHDLAEAGVPREAEPALLIRMAMLLREEGHPRLASEALRSALDRSGEGSGPVVASRVAKAARDLDPQTAELAAWRALASAELSLEERQGIERLLADVLPPMGERVTQAFSPPPDQPAAAAHEPPPGGAQSAQTARPATIDIQTNDRVLDAVPAVPVELDDEGVHIASGDGRKKLVRYQRIEAVSVAAVHGLGPKPVLLVDLVLNWMTPANETLRVIRFRGDKFDPRKVVDGHSSPVEALRALVERILERARATPLPDADSALGRPFASFDDLRIYQRAVLMVESAADPSS